MNVDKAETSEKYIMIFRQNLLMVARLVLAR